jgi:hypothetical protein
MTLPLVCLVAKKDAVTYYLSNISNTITSDSLDHQDPCIPCILLPITNDLMDVFVRKYTH